MLKNQLKTKTTQSSVIIASLILLATSSIALFLSWGMMAIATFYYFEETSDSLAVRGGDSSFTLFRRGDANGDEALNISDPIFILQWLFSGGATPQCLDAADANDDGRIDLTDSIYILNFLFGQNALAIPQPYPDLGKDETLDGLSCTTYPRGEVGLEPENMRYVWARNLDELRQLFANVINRDNANEPADYLRKLVNDLEERETPWQVAFGLALPEDIPDQIHYPLLYNDKADGANAVLASVCSSDEFCAECMNLSDPLAASSDEMAGAGGEADENNEPAISSPPTGCCQIECLPITAVEKPPLQTVCEVTTESQCQSCTEEFNRKCKEKYQSTNRCVGTPTWHEYGTCEESGQCKYPGTGAGDPPDIPPIKGICGTLSVAHSLARRFGVPADGAVDTNGNWDFNFLYNIFQQGTGKFAGRGMSSDEVMDAHRQVGSQYGLDIQCEQVPMGENLSRWCQHIYDSLRNGDDKTLTLHGINSEHAMHVTGIIMNSSGCDIFTKDTSLQGTGGGMNVPYEPGEQTWEFTPAHGDLHFIKNTAGRNSGFFNGQGYSRASVINCGVASGSP